MKMEAFLDEIKFVGKRWNELDQVRWKEMKFVVTIIGIISGTNDSMKP